MAFDFHFSIPEDSHSGRVIQDVAMRLHLTPAEAAEKVFEDGLRAQGNAQPFSFWGVAGEDADVLDEIVSDAMSHRRDRFAKRLNA